MRFIILLIAVIVAASMSTPVAAQGRGKGQANRPAKVDHGQPKASHPKPTSAPRAGKRPDGSTHVPKTETRVKGNPHKTPSPVPVVTDVAPTTPVSQAVKNPRLESRLLAMLPAGSNIQDASQGFKNWGQFVAAVHVSNNLGLPFDSLKTAMTGIPTGAQPGTVPATPMSLGQAIQSLKGGTAPDGSALTQTKIKSEVRKAEDAASADLRRTRDSN